MPQSQSKPKAVCNYRNKQDCPVPGQFNQNGVVYQATVTSNTGRVGTYVGLAKNFKKRYPKHKKCLLDETAEGGTALTTYYWLEKNAGRDPPSDLEIFGKEHTNFQPSNK